MTALGGLKQYCDQVQQQQYQDLPNTNERCPQVKQMLILQSETIKHLTDRVQSLIVRLKSVIIIEPSSPKGTSNMVAPQSPIMCDLASEIRHRTEELSELSILVGETINSLDI